MDIGRDLLLRNSECFNTVSLCCLAIQYPSARKWYSVKELGTAIPWVWSQAPQSQEFGKNLSCLFGWHLSWIILQIIFESSFHPYMMSPLRQPKQTGRHLNTTPLLKHIPILFKLHQVFYPYGVLTIFSVSHWWKLRIVQSFNSYKTWQYQIPFVKSNTELIDEVTVWEGLQPFVWTEL